MKRPENYNTKQSGAILAYISSLKGSHATVVQIMEHFENNSVPIGRTTVYRHLERLTENGRVRRFTNDGVSGACYQYIDEYSDCGEYFHLKCEDCGGLYHLQCDLINELKQHVLDKHTFQISALKTVFYGKCEACLQDG